MTENIRISDLPEFDAATWLDSDAAIADYLTLVLEEGDPALLAAALGDIARAKSRFADAAGGGIGTPDPLLDVLGTELDPRFETVARACRAVGLKLVARPVRETAEAPR